MRRSTPIPQGPGCIHPPNDIKLFTIFPSIETPMNLTLTNNFSKEQLQLVFVGNDFAFTYWGTICYDDAFGIPHYTNYCFQYKGKSMRAKDADPCLTHNDSN
jgi:hypothetical protein